MWRYALSTVRPPCAQGAAAGRADVARNGTSLRPLGPVNIGNLSLRMSEPTGGKQPQYATLSPVFSARDEVFVQRVTVRHPEPMRFLLPSPSCPRAVEHMAGTSAAERHRNALPFAEQVVRDAIRQTPLTAQVTNMVAGSAPQAAVSSAFATCQARQCSNQRMVRRAI